MGFFWQSQFGSPINAGAGSSPFDFVWLVAMENNSYSDINGNTTDCPYINNTLFGLGVKFSAWACVSNYGASQPNYLDATGGSNQSVTTNANPPGSVVAEPSVFSLVEGAGKTWKAYHQSYALVGTPQSTTITDGDGGTGVDGANPIYAEHHCPATHYTEIRNSTTRCPKIDDFTRLVGTAGGDFDTASLANTPTFAWISPDNDHNMHNGTGGSVSNARSRGDTELSTLIPILRSSYAFANRKCLIIVWWDEGQTGVTDPPVVFVGSASGNVKVNATSSTVHNHFAALSTVEWALGLGNTGRGEISTGHCAEAFN